MFSMGGKCAAAVGKVLTFSIAAYDVEECLVATLDSVLRCESADSIEAIIVDDGSHDGTASVAERYVGIRPDVFRLVRKQNGGYGSTINASIPLARGRYYKLLDGDDWVAPEAVDVLVGKLVACDADMVVTKFSKVYSDGCSETSPLAFPYDGVTRDIETVNIPIATTMHALAFRTDLLKCPPLDITEHCYYTDFEFMLKCVARSQSLASFDLDVYRYRLGRAGQSVSAESQRRNLGQHMRLTMNVARLYEGWVLSGGFGLNKGSLLRTWTFDTIYNRYKNFVDFGPSAEMSRTMAAFDEELRRRWPEIWRESMDYGHPAVRLVRKSGLALYYPISALTRLRAGIKKLRPAVK